MTLGDYIILPQFELATPGRSTCDESLEYGKRGGKIRSVKYQKRNDLKVKFNSHVCG